jgi:hypothetical protein
VRLPEKGLEKIPPIDNFTRMGSRGFKPFRVNFGLLGDPTNISYIQWRRVMEARGCPGIPQKIWCLKKFRLLLLRLRLVVPHSIPYMHLKRLL